MNKFLEEKVMPLAQKVGEQKYMIALRDGIVLSMPLIIIGSLFLVLVNLPIPGYAEFMANIFGSNWANKVQYIIDATFSLMGLITAFGVAYALAQRYRIDGVSCGILSLAAFLLSTPLNEKGGIQLSLIGSKGLFVAMIIAIVSTEIFNFFIKKKITIKMPNGVPEAVGKSFAALLPGIAIIVLFWSIRLTLESTGIGNIHDIVTLVLGKPLKFLGSSLIGNMVAILLLHLFWMCGIHGGNVVGPIMWPMWLQAMDQNRVAFQAGKAIPNIITTPFYDMFVFMGGAGTTVALTILIIIFAKSSHFKQIGKIGGVATFFNINEPMMFGLPIVLNPVFIIPFILTPIVLMTVTYFAMSTGLIAKTVGIAVPWTMPPLISGYLATGGKISGVVMQLVNILIAMVIYYPFFRVTDKKEYENELKEIENGQIDK